MEAPHARSEPTLSSVEAFRASARANGYTPIPVRTRSKQPVGKDWPSGGKLERLVNIVKEELNTGILAAGLRCIDVDVDEPQIAAAIKKKILARFPDAIFRGRANTSRFAAGLRAAEGEPGKRSMAGPLGKIEILGAGQQFVAHGVHQSGAAIEWENGRGPDTIPRNQLPAVTEEQINELLNECAPLLGSSNAASAPGTVNKLFEEQSAPLSTHFSSTAPDAND